MSIPAQGPCHLEGQPGIGSVECRHLQQPSGGEAKVRLGSAAEQSFATGGAGTPNPAPTPPQTPGGDGLQCPEGLHLDPVGLHGAWNAAAEQRLLECLTAKEGGDPKASCPAIAAPAPALALIFLSRAERVLLKLPVPHPQRTRMLLLRSFSLKMARCPIPRLLPHLLPMPEYVPNPSLPPPPEYPSDDEYGVPNPSWGPQSEVFTDDEYLAPPAPAAPCEESHERPAKCQRCQEREEEFWSLAESHQLIAELLGS